MSRRPRAIAEAESLRQRLGLGHGFVDVFAVIRELGVELYQRPFAGDNLDGAHVIRAGVGFIFVNSASAITRQRFTAAHEFGHHLLHWEEGAAVFEQDVLAAGGDAREQDANSFAGHFLVDAYGLQQLAGTTDDEEGRIAAAAAEYVVSIEAAAIQLCDLRLISHSTKRHVLIEIKDGRVKPAGFLGRYGFELAQTPKVKEPVLDPRHVQRALDTYASGQMTLVGLADALSTSETAARKLLRDYGVEERSQADVPPDEPEPWEE